MSFFFSFPVSGDKNAIFVQHQIRHDDFYNPTLISGRLQLLEQSKTEPNLGCKIVRMEVRNYVNVPVNRGMDKARGQNILFSLYVVIIYILVAFIKQIENFSSVALYLRSKKSRNIYIYICL